MQKQALLFLPCFESVHYQCNFDTRTGIFSVLDKSLFCSANFAMLWLCLAASWSRLFVTLEL